MGRGAGHATRDAPAARPAFAPTRHGVTPALLERLAGASAVPLAARAALAVRAPFTGALLGHLPHGVPEDVAAAVAGARRAQPAWAARGVAERAAVVLRFHDLLLERREQLLDLVQLEAGKARRHVLEELADTAIVARYYGRRAARLLRPRRRRGAVPGLTRAWEFRQPVGVVGCMAPWNYPLNLAVTDAIPALLAGNAVVLRPDHQTSFTALWLVSLLREAGLPVAVMPVVTGVGPELGPALMAHVDFAMFTGSTATGRIIARQAAERLIGCSLELGGKNPMLLLDDADLEAAVDGAVRGCFVGAGQVCVSLERIYVPAALHDAFVTRFVARTRALRLGVALDYSVDVGSLASARQLETVTTHVRDALDRGATLLAGGHPRPDIGPYFHEPTILGGVTPGMLAYAEETFGPVVAVYPYHELDDAIARANDTRYGLSASVWSRRVRRAVAVARRLHAGTVNVNEAYSATWASVDAAIGGMKESGHGRRHGREGLLKYTELQTVAAQRGRPLAVPPGLDGLRAERALARVLRLWRRLPGLR